MINIDQLFEMASGFASRIDAAGFPGQPAAYEVNITGAGGGVFSAEISSDRISLSRTARPDAICSLTASAETAEALLSGKLKPMNALLTGKVRMRGDMSDLMRLAALLTRK